MFIEPYQKIISKTYYNKENQYDVDLYQMSYYLRNAINDPEKMNNCYLLMDDTTDHLFLYLRMLEDKGARVSFKTRKELKAGDTVIVWEQHVKDYIATNYNYETIENYNVVSKYKLMEKL
jgi:hypothetical protein